MVSGRRPHELDALANLGVDSLRALASLYQSTAGFQKPRDHLHDQYGKIGVQGHSSSSVTGTPRARASFTNVLSFGS